MFYGCKASTISFVNCDFSNVKNTHNIFYGCDNLKTIHADETSLLSLITFVPESTQYIDDLPEFSESDLLKMVHDDSASVRRIGVENITDENVLIDSLYNDPDYIIRKNAFEKLKRISPEKIDDNSVFIDIAKNDLDINVRCNAIEKIDDESVLIDLAYNNPNKDIIITSVENITDMSILEDIALNHESNDARFIATKKLNNKSILEKISVNDSDKQVRKIAKERLDEL